MTSRSFPRGRSRALRAAPVHSGTSRLRGRSLNRTATPPIQLQERSLSPETFPEPEFNASDSDHEERSLVSQERADTPPPVLISPIKRRSRVTAPSINKMSDLEVWDMPDETILDAARVSWRSDAYDHYIVTLQREEHSEKSPASLTFVFTCKTNPKMHKVIFRPRIKTGEGTSNLVRTMNMCLVDQGLPASTSSRQPKSSHSISYSPAAHRALIALRCAKNGRPFNAVVDEDYQLEVDMLCPGTLLPTPRTVSRDINTIYVDLSRHVEQYFKALPDRSKVHLVLDGWTSPLVSSYLGIVVIWYNKGAIHRTILEFIRLTEKHDGRYLAKVLADCAVRFKLDKRLFSICMDNASNCDKLAELLPQYLPGFPGATRRLHCLAHIFNLIAKVFISFFFKKPKQKKTVRVARGSGGQNFARPGEADPTSEDEDVFELEAGNEMDDQDAAVEEEAEASLEDADGDDGQVIHDDRVAKTLQEKAIYHMEMEYGIFLDPEEIKISAQIFPRVSGLARRIHDNAGVLKEKFDRLVANDDALTGSRTALARRVPTRWNSDLDCLISHFYFKEVIIQLTAIPSLNLGKYRLSAEQWKIAEEIREILFLFDDVTKIFSVAEVPLVVDVISTLEDLRGGLIAARDDNQNDVSDIVRVACQAGIFLIDKYSVFAENSDIYLIAIVMCPDRKLKWFKDHGRDKYQIKDIEKKVRAAWDKSYAPPAADAASPTPNPVRKERSRYAPAVKETIYPADHISTYIKEPLLPTSTIREAGGYMHYWNLASSSRPLLAQMASDYCSAPATSVDAERAFSTGRRQVNFMQTNMNSQTFKAQMAVGSWARSPIYPGIDYIRKIIDKDSEDPFLA